MEKTKNLSSKIKKLCLAGVMAALYVGLDFLAVSVSAPFGGSLKISLSGLPVIITAIFGGPLWGAAAGFIGAFIGQLITYGFGPTTLLWVLPAVVRGLLSGYLFIVFKRSIKPGALAVQTCISSIAVTLINTGALLIDHAIYGYSSYVTIFADVPLRLVTGVITALIFTLMLPTIINSLRQYMKV